MTGNPLVHDQQTSTDPAMYLDRKLSDNEKVMLFTERWTPPRGYCYPVTGGRRYNALWENEYAWLRYSVSMDAGFCVYCLLFGEKSGTGVHLTTFQIAGFCYWKNAKGKKRGALPIHESTDAHKAAAIKALAFKDIATGKAEDIQSLLSTSYREQIMKHRAIIMSIIDIIIVLGQRNIPLRGHSWSKDTRSEDGNFEYFLQWKAEDPCLQQHIKSCRKNASYKSAHIQNELIDLAGMEVRDIILHDIRSSVWFSVMADECTDISTVEQMSICIRFVDRTPAVREEDLGFVQLESTNAESISKSILDFLSSCSLDICNLQGQGYDGASVMASKVSGVSARILEVQPRALYLHCRAHNLNLVISSSCKQVPEIRNLHV